MVEFKQWRTRLRSVPRTSPAQPPPICGLMDLNGNCPFANPRPPQDVAARTPPIRPPRPKTSLPNLRPKIILSPIATPPPVYQLPCSTSWTRTKDENELTFTEDVFAALHPYMPRTSYLNTALWDLEAGKHLLDERTPKQMLFSRPDLNMSNDGDISCSDLDLSIPISRSRAPSSCGSDVASNARGGGTYRYPEDRHISSWRFEEEESACTYTAPPTSRGDHESLNPQHMTDALQCKATRWQLWLDRYRRQVWMVLTISVVLGAAAAITGGIMWKLTKSEHTKLGRPRTRSAAD